MRWPSQHHAATFVAVTALPELLDHAIMAAFAAGREILDVYSRPIAVDLKDDRSPLTEADRRAHTAISVQLEKTGLPVLSEEGKTTSVEDRQCWDRYWLVDPLDGTKEFIKRNGEFTVNIALMGRADPIPGPSPVGKGEMHPIPGPSADARYTVLDARKYGRLKEFARDMHKEPTAAEAAMWRMLRHDNLEVRFRRQHILDEFIVDFVCLKKRLVVEIDGDVHNETVEADALRTQRLEEFGFHVIRFTNHEVLADEAKVFDRIREEVAARPTFTTSMDYEQFPNPVGDPHSSFLNDEGRSGSGSLPHRGRVGDGVLGTHQPIAGVLYVPVSDLLYFAWNGGGSYRIAQAKTFNTTSAYELAARAERLPMPRQHEAFTIVASRSHASPDTDAYIARKEQEHGTVKLTSMGSALKICLVAEGAADAYPRYAPTMEWDTAAGHAIANEAGRQLIDVTTNAPMCYNKASLVNNWFIVQ